MAPKKRDGHGLEAGQRQPSRAQACRGAKGGAKGQGGHQGIEDCAGNTQGNAGQPDSSEDRASRSVVLGDRGRVRVVLKTLATVGGRQPAIPARRGHQLGKSGRCMRLRTGRKRQAE